MPDRAPFGETVTVLTTKADKNSDLKLSERTLRLSDGTPMPYWDVGAGPVVMLIHGWAASRQMFVPIIEDLAQSHRVIVPALRGHGAALGEGEAQIDQLADDIHTVLTALDLDQVTLLGWSMGAMIMWRLVLRHGDDRVAGMIVEDMSPRIINDAGWALGMLNGLDRASSEKAARLMKADWPAYARAFTPRVFAPGRVDAEPGLLERTQSLMEDRDPDAMAALWSSMVDQDLRTDLTDITTPTLVTFGERSQAYGPATSDFLVATLPNAQSKGFAHSGHAPHLEEPEEFAGAVRDFVSGLQPAVHPHTIPEGSKS